MVLVKVKPLIMPNASTDTILAMYTNWYMWCSVSCRVWSALQAVLLLWGGQMTCSTTGKKYQESIS